MLFPDSPFEGRRTRVLLVDDQVSVREMVALVLDREGQFVVVAEASSGTEALTHYRRHKPELVILGLALPEMGGAETLRALRQEAPEARLLIFSGTRNHALLREGIKARPHGFVHKTEPLETLRHAVHAVARGHRFFGAFATQIEQEIADGEQVATELTPRQRRVLQLIAEGNSTREVATQLDLSPKTIEHYRNQIMQRLNVRDVASLVRHALQTGLVN